MASSGDALGTFFNAMSTQGGLIVRGELSEATSARRRAISKACGLSSYDATPGREVASIHLVVLC